MCEGAEGSGARCAAVPWSGSNRLAQSTRLADVRRPSPTAHTHVADTENLDTPLRALLTLRLSQGYQYVIAELRKTWRLEKLRRLPAACQLLARTCSGNRCARLRWESLASRA